MWKFIKRILGMRNPQDPYIYHYWDGTRKRSADPIAIEISLRDSLGKDWLDKLQKLHAPIPLGAIGVNVEEIENTRDKLRLDVLNAIDKAFNVHAYTDFGGRFKPAGLLDAARLGLLNAYIRFSTDLVRLSRPFGKQQSRASPTLNPPPTPNT